MAGQALFSELELYILLTVLRLGDEAYGVAIATELATLHPARVSTSAIYAALDRLVERGLATSVLGEATPERGGRAKRYFRLTDQGIAALRQTHTTLSWLWRFLPAKKGSV